MLSCFFWNMIYTYSIFIARSSCTLCSVVLIIKFITSFSFSLSIESCSSRNAEVSALYVTYVTRLDQLLAGLCYIILLVYHDFMERSSLFCDSTISVLVRDFCTITCALTCALTIEARFVLIIPMKRAAAVLVQGGIYF